MTVGATAAVEFGSQTSGNFLAGLVCNERYLFFRLHFDGAFETLHSGVQVAAPSREVESAAQKWLGSVMEPGTGLSAAVDLILQAWWLSASASSFSANTPPVADRQKGWREGIAGKTVEIGWLQRVPSRAVCYRACSLAELGLA